LPEQYAPPAREALVNKRSLSGTLGHHTGSASPGPGLKHILSNFLSMHAPARARVTIAWHVICEWERRRRSRQVLQSLSLREIRDFSPDLSAAEREVSKPFWRA
jgi:uncharacterized protein YjiS (DUF1127 family)